MNRDQDEQHAKYVGQWIERNLKGLPAEQQLRIFEAAVSAIQKRILVTLSDVTLTAVLDRALYQSQQKYPLLSRIKVEATGISLDRLISKQNQVAELTDAFRYFLIELFTILENLTAGILTHPLYKELSQVTAKSKSAKDGEDA